MESYLNEMNQIQKSLDEVKAELSIINRYLSSEQELRNEILEFINLTFENIDIE